MAVVMSTLGPGKKFRLPNIAARDFNPLHTFVNSFRDLSMC